MKYKNFSETDHFEDSIGNSLQSIFANIHIVFENNKEVLTKEDIGYIESVQTEIYNLNNYLKNYYKLQHCSAKKKKSLAKERKKLFKSRMKLYKK